MFLRLKVLPMKWLLPSLLLLAVVAELPQANADSKIESYRETVLKDSPAAYWRFDGSAEERLANEVAEKNGELSAVAVGNVKFAQDGPRPGRFVAFSKQNAAFALDGRNGYLKVADPGKNSPLDFSAGETLTLEAWVNVQGLSNGQTRYILGKGRTARPGVAGDNQNYALRILGQGGSAGLSFLFRNEKNRRGNRGDWHRWDSQGGFYMATGWHHVVVSYTFGKPDSMRAYVDGEPISGEWNSDYGQPTKDGPVVDDDELWIGSSMGGSAGSTFLGRIDEVAIYRHALSPERIAAHYRIDPEFKPAGNPPPEDLPKGEVLVEVIEGIPDANTWDYPRPETSDTYRERSFAFTDVPHYYNEHGVRDDRTNPFLLRASGLVTLPAGEYRLLVRSRGGARVYVDGKLVAQGSFFSVNGGAHGKVRKVDDSLAPNIRLLQPGDNEKVVPFTSPGKTHRIVLESIVGGKNRRPEIGELSVCLAKPGEDFYALSPAGDTIPLTDQGWKAFEKRHYQELAELNQQRRREAQAIEAPYWQQRHELARQIVAEQEAIELPAVLDSLPVNNAIDRFISAKLAAEDVEPTELTDDMAFLRRVCLDVIGTIPTPQQIAEFQADTSPERRAKLIDRLLQHPGWADHWVSYWQDVLAENPNILNPTLNNTGPFRWWIHESFADNKPFDRFVTELIMMRGSAYFGGPAGFEMATQNDSPMAAKAHIIGQAFLGAEMKCARCHDAPFHDFGQRDLFSLAAMLGRKPLQVPKTSTINVSPEELEKMAVKVTLKPGERISADWPFDRFAPAEAGDTLIRNPKDSRERLAVLVTSPQNERFAKVIVNRLWHRYLGRGLVNPVDDWEYPEPSHPELLEYLADEFVANGYDLKHLARLILNSHAYQRQPLDQGDDRAELFAGPTRRRMRAEQVVDSILLSADKTLKAEELNLDVAGSRSYKQSINLGKPRRAWQMASLSNERDRPSLSLPYVQHAVNVLEAFGWRPTRQNPVTTREQEPTVLQPAILANGVMSRRVCGLSPDSRFTELALQEQPVEKLVEQVFRQILTREPTTEETQLFVALLSPGYQDRKTGVPEDKDAYKQLSGGGVSWSNHLSEEANRIKIEMERQARRGDPPTKRLTPQWRERMEDMVWALLNSPEFVFLP